MPGYRTRLLTLAGAIALASQGCAAVGLTLFTTGAGLAGTGTSYTLDSVAYRTFTAPIDDLRRATLTALRRMDVKVQTDEATTDGRRVEAEATDRSIDIELERLTARATRMRVLVKHGWILRDRATATEIVAQTTRSVEHLRTISQTAR